MNNRDAKALLKAIDMRKTGLSSKDLENVNKLRPAIERGDGLASEGLVLTSIYRRAWA
jgi:hypothetical protein